MGKKRFSGGQESAPFELLIAVIVMTFVMMFGYRAINEMHEADCRARINQEMVKMKTALESTTNQRSIEKVVFNIPGCFKDARVELNSVRNRVVCSSICQEGRKECVSLDYWSDSYVHRVCINIPMHTEFEGSISGGPGTYCPDRRSSATGEAISYTLVPLTDKDVGVLSGTYVLENRTPPGWAKPIVCAYRME